MGDRAVLRFGLARSSVERVTAARVDELCRVMAQATGTDVETRVFDDYDEMLDNVGAGVDLAWLPPAVALTALATGRAVALALPLRSGSWSYDAALYTHPASGIERLADLRGATVGWVDPKSASGYLVMRAWLQEQGLDLAQAFREERFLGSHDAVAEAVLGWQVDVGATFVDRPRPGRVPVAGWGDAEVRVLAQAGPIAADLLAASVVLPPALRDALVSGLLDEGSELECAASVMFEAEGFAEPTAEYQDLLRRLEPWLARRR